MRYAITLSKFLTITALAMSSLLAGCDMPAGSPPNPASDASFGEADQVYTVRGRIVRVPSEGPPPVDLTVHHEAIPDFIGGTGDVHVNPNGELGMLAMRMPFPLVSPDVDVNQFAEGDVVEMTFEVRWLEGARPTWRVIKLAPLAADTDLDL